MRGQSPLHLFGSTYPMRARRTSAQKHYLLGFDWNRWSEYLLEQFSKEISNNIER